MAATLRGCLLPLLIVAGMVAAMAAYWRVADYVYERNCDPKSLLHVVDPKLYREVAAVVRRNKETNTASYSDVDVHIERETTVVPFVYRQWRVVSRRGKVSHYVDQVYLNYPNLVPATGNDPIERQCHLEHLEQLPEAARF